jgi:uncharacterized protein (DUF983 family)
MSSDRYRGLVKVSRPSFPVMAVRALTLRCPWCGSRRSFLRGWFRRHPRCRTCGIAWSREVGVELGAVTMSLIITFGAIAVCMGVGFALTLPDVPLVPLMLGIGLVALCTPIAVYPMSYTLWLAFDLAVHPPDAAELEAAARAVAATSVGAAA